MKEFFVTFAIVLTLGCGASLMMHACTPTTETVKAAAYGTALAACRADAGSYEAYEQCALGVDAKFGVKR